MQFKYDNSGVFEKLSLRTNQKVLIEVAFDGNKVSHVNVGRNEYEPQDDDLYGLFVGIGGLTAPQMVSIEEIVIAAKNIWPDIQLENEDDCRLERSHESYVRSLGR